MILWHRWRDPLAHMVHGKKDESELEEALNRHAQDQFCDEDTPCFDEDRPRQGQTGPGIVWPGGLIPLHEENLPGKLYNFWMGHTDFPITSKVMKKIERVAGVESIDVFTPYRFRVAIGKAFDPPKVRGDIDRVTSPPNPLAALEKALDRGSDAWAIYVMPDGKVQTSSGENRGEVEKKGAGYAAKAREVVRSWEREK